MDFWDYSDDDVRKAAENKTGKRVRRLLYRTTGLHRDVELDNGEQHTVRDDDVRKVMLDKIMKERENKKDEE